MDKNITYLAQCYFHQDFPDEVGDPSEVLEAFRKLESLDMVVSLRTEVVELIDSDSTDEELRRMWLIDAKAYYDPGNDDMTMREWLRSIADVLHKTTDASTADADLPARPESISGIPFKGTKEF